MTPTRPGGGRGRSGAKPGGRRKKTGTRRNKRAPGARRGASAVASQPAPTNDGQVRLQKVIASAGVASRRKAEVLIRDGFVAVNGRVVRELGTRVDPTRDRVSVRGEPIQIEHRVYFVLNKPDGVVCSAEGAVDARGRPTVRGLLGGVRERVYPVGRLDYHTRGVLIMTNDGALAAGLTHPRHRVPKTYHVKFQGRPSMQAIEALQRGVELEDGTPSGPAENVSVIKETETNTWIQLTIRRGLNRQVRRMGDAIGHPVLKLIRVAIGGLTADGLDDGQYRPLTVGEIYDLRALCGLG